MFEGVIKRAERSVDSLVSKYVGRAVVAVPLLVAGGFGTAALTVKLIEVYGQVTAYGIVAAAFAVLGLLAAAIGLGSRPVIEQIAAAAEEQAKAREDEKPAEDLGLLTPELTAVLSSAAPLAIPPVLRAMMRNLPILLVLAVIAYVFSQQTNDAETPPESEAALVPEADVAAAAETAAMASQAA